MPTENAQARAAAHNTSQAIVHGAVDPLTVLRRKRGGPAVAGVYELVALVWHEPKRDEHGRLFTVKHVRGELVELSADDADRLLRAGAVKPTSAEQEESEAAQEETALDKATAYQAAHGPVPADESDEHVHDAVEGNEGGQAPRL